MQGVPVLCQVDPHTGTNTANGPALMVVCRVGLDIRGLFPRAVEGFWYLYVIVDKFTK
jgi:hypothetical protein